MKSPRQLLLQLLAAIIPAYGNETQTNMFMDKIVQDKTGAVVSHSTQKVLEMSSLRERHCENT